MSEIASDDIRAAVAAGVITEEQAAKLEILAERRHGYRAHMTDEDEPFEFFKGFSEIFVAVGITILFMGIGALATLMASFSLVPLVGMALAWGFAEYFTLKRRMTLPSIVLSLFFGANAFVAVSIQLLPTINQIFNSDALFDPWRPLAIFSICLLLMIAFFLRFRLPFSTFIMGLFGIGIVFSLALMINPEMVWGFNGFESLFDLTNNSNIALATTAFGVIAFLFAMAFDMRDPHRVSRYSASAFWLHILAAPALVNTIAYSLLNMGGGTGYLLTAVALIIITLLAIIIDRRSFLTAGLIYVAIIIGWTLSQADGRWSNIQTLLILGAFVTALGTWWTQIRAAIMRALPNFPFKHRLPPYAEAL